MISIQLRFVSLLFISILFFPIDSYSQDIAYAKEVINALTSPEMHGRGYVKKGDQKAAEYIKQEYQKLGLKPYLQDYYQQLTIPVNTFPGKMSVKLDKVELKPGVDYIVHPGTRSYSAKYKLRTLSKPVVTVKDIKSFFRRDHIHVIEFSDTVKRSDKQEVMEYLSKFAYGEGTVIMEPKKLTWSVSNTTNKKPIIYILKSSFNSKAQTITLRIKNKLIRGYKTQNIVGYIPGEEKPDSFIFVTAHYDHLGRMGKATYFPGANDNASGVSMLLQMAKYFAEEANKPKYSMVFVCFAAEEAGLLGSRFFVESFAFPLGKIKFLLNMDLLGTGEDGMTVVNGSVFKDAFDQLTEINNEYDYLVKIKMRGKAANSDHYFFTEAGVPSFFFYTMGGISAYHDVYDIADTLPLTEYEDVFKLFVDFIHVIK